MTEKTEYQIPVITVISLDATDILTASTAIGNGFDGETDSDNW